MVLRLGLHVPEAERASLPVIGMQYICHIPWGGRRTVVPYQRQLADLSRRS